MTNENPRASNWTKLNNFLSQAAVAALVAAVTAAFVSVFFQEIRRISAHGELKPALVEVLSRRPRLGEAVGTSAACPSRPEISN